jgi:hypothetical protein
MDEEELGMVGGLLFLMKLLFFEVGLSTFLGSV